MADNPVQVVVAAFSDEDGAKAAVEQLKAAKVLKHINVLDGAVLRKDDVGKLHIQETTDWGGGKGAAIGGVAGGAIGLLAGPALIVPAALGALVGGLAAKLHDSDKDNRLRTIGEGLQPGSSAIVAVVEHKWVEQARQEMAAAGADMVAEGLKSDIAEQLEAGHDVAYTALATQGGFMTGREAGDKDRREGDMLIVGKDEEAQVNYVATPEGFAAYGVDATPEGVTEAAAVDVSDSQSSSGARGRQQ